MNWYEVRHPLPNCNEWATYYSLELGPEEAKRIPMDLLPEALRPLVVVRRIPAREYLAILQAHLNAYPSSEEIYLNKILTYQGAH